MSTFETKYKIGDTFEGFLDVPQNIRTYRVNGIYAHMNDDMIPHIGYFLEDYIKRLLNKEDIKEDNYYLEIESYKKAVELIE